MRKRHWIAIVAALVVAAGTIAGATQSAAIPLFNSRGTIEPFEIHDHGMHFKLKAGRPIDVAVVGARLDPSGETGWHMHPAKSLVTVQPGSPNLRMVYVEDGECVERDVPGRHGLRASSRRAQLRQHQQHRAAELRRRLLRPSGGDAAHQRACAA